MAADPSLDFVINLPFKEQIDFFRQKLDLPTERWDDIWQAAHDRAFVVAGAMKADLLNDLRLAVDKAIASGTTLKTFRKDFAATVAKHGWTGWTGEATAAGRSWRTRVIYETNMRTSYAAGRWAQLHDPELQKRAPYWRYIHSDSVLSPRPQHKAWGDSRLTLRFDHPFWQTHFPPNGWGCRCRIVAVHAPGQNDATELPAGWNTRGENGQLPGIDRGWDYAPGARADDSLRSFVQDKLITLPQAISKALSWEVNRYINGDDRAADFVRAVLADRKRIDPLWLGFVDDPQRIGKVVNADVRGYLLLLPADVPRHVEASHEFDGKGQRQAGAEDYARLADLVNSRDTTLRSGELSRHGMKTVVTTGVVNGETFRAVWEVLPGKRNRALSLLSLVIKLK